MNVFIASLLQSSAIIILPTIVILSLTLMAIPSLAVPGVKPDHVMKGIASYVMKTFGVILVSIGAIQCVESLIRTQLPNTPTLSALLILIVVGIGIMVHESTVLESLDDLSIAIPRLIFSHGCEIVGCIIALVSITSLIVSYVTGKGGIASIEGWESIAAFLLYGTTLMFASSIHIHHRNKKLNKGKRK